MKAEIVTITPDLARHWLTKNTNNRSLRKGHVTWLAKQMKEGQWVTSPQPISFDTSGSLIDGQHRLSAIDKAGIPVKMLVITNADSESFKVIDTGKRRNACDVLDISGVPNFVLTSAVIRKFLLIKNGYFSQVNVQDAPSSITILDEYNRRSDFWYNTVIKAKTLYKSSMHLIEGSHIGAMLAYWHDAGENTEFIEGVLTDNHSVLNARELNRFLTNQKFKRIRMTPLMIYSLFFKYHAHWKNGNSIKVIKMAQDENVPFF